MSKTVKSDRQPRRSILRSLATATLAASLLAGVGVVAPTAEAAIIPGRCTYTASQPTLRQGSSGTAVRQLQCELNYSLRYTKVSVDGSFGPQTRQAVRIFQSCTGIAVDGVVGAVTWGRLNAWAG